MIRRAGLLFAALAIAALPAAPRVEAADKAKDDETLNYFLRVPERWTFRDPGDLSKYGVAALADCRLETLADGKTPGAGQGGRVVLSVQDVPKDFEPDYETWLFEWQALVATTADDQEIDEEVAKKIAEAKAKLEKPLATLAARPAVLDLYLNRFDKDPKKWPRAEPDGADQLGGLPAASVRVDGECPNLDGTPGTCESRMFVWVVRKRLYRLVIWIWPNKYDRELMRDDADNIELNYQTPKSTAIPKKMPDPSKAVDPAGGKADPEALTEATKTDLAFGFSIKKPVKFKPLPIDRTKPDQANLGYRMDAINGPSSVIVELLVYRVKNAAVPFDLDSYLRNTWIDFDKTHPKGDILTAPFPPVTPRSSFLSLPLFEKKRFVAAPGRVVRSSKEKPGAEGDKPPEKPAGDKPPAKPEKEEKLSISDLEKLGLLTESKKIELTGEKIRNNWRVCIEGNRERFGEELYMNWCFSTSDRSYILRIICRRDGLAVFKPEIQQILASFKILEEPK